MSAIIRVWYGTAHREHADDYANHVKNDIFPKFAKMKGNRGAKVLRRDVEDGVSSWWSPGGPAWMPSGILPRTN
jgi:hypothetical protein